MSALTKRIFGKYAAPIALGIGAAATAFIPAAGVAQTMQAQPAAANANVQATPVTFQTSDARNISVRGVQAGAAEASRDKIAIIVWGGSRELQQQAYNAALDLRDQGIPLAFIVGPDLNGYTEDADFQVYARSLPQYEGNGATFGGAHADEVRPTVVRMGQNAFRNQFPRELAALDVR
ncbi:hypothetical protein LBX01_08435 [Altererythrobacter sp. N1]|nr:hypothetical protein LBX01_08435 [Altererythrobacter sp. N1]